MVSLGGVVVGADVVAGRVVPEASSARVDGGELAAEDDGASVGCGRGGVVPWPGCGAEAVVSDRRLRDLSLESGASDDGVDGVVSLGAVDVDAEEEVGGTVVEILDAASVADGGAVAGSDATESSTGRST